jgi:hypothetical protein
MGVAVFAYDDVVPDIRDAEKIPEQPLAILFCLLFEVVNGVHDRVAAPFNRDPATAINVAVRVVAHEKNGGPLGKDAAQLALTGRSRPVQIEDY